MEEWEAVGKRGDLYRSGTIHEDALVMSPMSDVRPKPQ